jgi:hypothetical protein
MQSIKKSLNDSKSKSKSKSPLSLSNNKPFNTKSLQTLIDTPINSIISKKETPLESIQSSIKKTASNIPDFNTIKSTIKKTTQSKPPSTIDNIKSSIKKTTLTLPYNSNPEKSPLGFNFKIFLIVFIITFILAFLGLNIFTYLAKGTDFLKDLFGPIASAIADITGNTAKTVITNTSEGSKQVLDKTSETGKNIVDYTEKGSATGITFLQDQLRKTKAIAEPDPENDNKLSDEDNKKIDNNDSEPEPVRTAALEQGYCYIGKINDTRYCSKISGRAQCMSGEIFPTEEICINPNLRM